MLWFVRYLAADNEFGVCGDVPSLVLNLHFEAHRCPVLHGDELLVWQHPQSVGKT